MLPDSAFVRKMILGSIPLMFMMTFLLYEAYQRSLLPPYVLANQQAGLQYEDYMIDLKHVMFVFLWVAFLCLVLIFYCLHTVPRKRAFLRKYLDEGNPIVGDVFYPEDQTCYGLFPQYGTVTYPDPRANPRDKAYIRRKVRIYQNFSREWAHILVLPDRPYSGHPRGDVEMAYLATDRQKPAMQFMAVYAGIWAFACVASAAYVMMVVADNQYEDEFPKGWMWYWICVLAMPLVAFGVDFLIYQKFVMWMSKGDGKLLEEGEKDGKAASGGDGNAATADGEYQQMSEGQQA